VQALWAQIQSAGAPCGTGMVRAQDILRAARKPDQVMAEGRQELERIHAGCATAAATIHRMAPPPSIENSEGQSRMRDAIARCSRYRVHQHSALGHVLTILRGQGDTQHHLSQMQLEQSKFGEALSRCRDGFAAAASAAGATFDSSPGNSS